MSLPLSLQLFSHLLHNTRLFIKNINKMSKQVKPYHYYDTPDGEDVLKKLWFVLKPASMTVLGIGTFDVMYNSKPKGYMATLGRYAYVSIPIIGMSTVFVLGSNLLRSIRKKDDIWNWVGAGAAAGSILGIWRKSQPAAYIWAAVCGFSGGVKKHCHENGIIIIPDLRVSRMHGGHRYVRHDWSLLKDEHGEWKKKYE